MPTTQQPEQRAPHEGAVRGPGKAMRIEAMTGELLEELRGAPLDEASRARVAAIHDRTVRELADALPEGMRQELARLVNEFGSGGTPSDGELRVAQAQLLGWLGGVVAAVEVTMAQQALSGTSGTSEPDAEPVPPERPPALGDGPTGYL